MINLNNLRKFIILLTLIISGQSLANEDEKIIFSLDNKIFTSIDVDNRKKYLILNNSNEKISNDEVLKDLISIEIFDKYYQNRYIKEITSEDINTYYEKIFQKYELNINNKFYNLFKEIEKDNIIKNITLDYQRKIIIEKILNTKKNLIFLDQGEEYDYLYDIFIKFISLNSEYIDKINLNIYELNSLKEELTKQNINYTNTEKKVKFSENLHPKIKKAIINNDKRFIINNNNYIIFGNILKKIKDEENIGYSIVQLKTKNKIIDKELSCKNKNFFKKNLNIEYSFNENIEYKKLNINIKNRLINKNDSIEIKDGDKYNYLILCKINYNIEYFNQIRINQRIQTLVKEIENDFILNYSDKYNLIKNDK